MGKGDELAGVDVLKMRTKCALAIAIGLAALLPSASLAQTASEALPNTPPELRDFRLDQPKETPKQVTPPPVTPTVEPQPKEQAAPTPTREQAAPRPSATPRERVPRQQAPSTQEQADTEAAPVSKAAPETTVPTVEPTTKPALPESTAAPVADDQGTGFPMWLLWVGLAVVALGGAAILLRRRKIAGAEEAYEEPAPVAFEPESVSTAEAVVEPEPEPVVVPEPVAVAAQPGTIIAPVPAQPKKALLTNRPQMEVVFTPLKATISVTNLTVSGRLRIVNVGDAVAQDLKLRVALTSARHNQPEIIANFHADAPDFPAEEIGEAKPGENLDLSLELQVPLNELQSFPVGEQQLFVPVMIANLAYGWGGKVDLDTVETACLIGRESTPPQAKMGPLRLDLGPRSFDGLGQRPLAA